MSVLRNISSVSPVKHANVAQLNIDALKNSERAGSLTEKVLRLVSIHQEAQRSADRHVPNNKCCFAERDAQIFSELFGLNFICSSVVPTVRSGTLAHASAQPKRDADCETDDHNKGRDLHSPMAGVRAENEIAELQHATIGTKGLANKCTKRNRADGWV